VRLLLRVLLIASSAALCVAPRTAIAQERSIDALERSVADDPENLELAARYRQLAIADHTFDRPIDFFERLTKRKATGPNVYISLALAYVDKVPASGDIRRLYLGRDAMGALTKAIEHQPSVLAYYLRGVINLFYNRFIFNRVTRGIADLEHALTLITPETPPALVRRAYTSLGDGHSKQGNSAMAREIWALGLHKFPGDADLEKRLAPGADVADIVTTALYAGRRIDTTLGGLIAAR